MSGFQWRARTASISTARGATDAPTGVARSRARVEPCIPLAPGPGGLWRSASCPVRQSASPFRRVRGRRRAGGPFGVSQMDSHLSRHLAHRCSVRGRRVPEGRRGCVPEPRAAPGAQHHQLARAEGENVVLEHLAVDGAGNSRQERLHPSLVGVLLHPARGIFAVGRPSDPPQARGSAMRALSGGAARTRTLLCQPSPSRRPPW